MESNLSEFEQEPAIRPVLLNVLCILTFIGSSWAILTNIWAYTMAGKTAKMVSDVRQKNMPEAVNKKDSILFKNANKKHPEFAEKMMLSLTKLFTEEAIKRNAVGNIISATFTLAGAILMWRLKRVGFYLYIAGIVIGIVIPFYLFGNNLLAIGISSFSNFFGLVFIALYALNFSSFKK